MEGEGSSLLSLWKNIFPRKLAAFPSQVLAPDWVMWSSLAAGGTGLFQPRRWGRKEQKQGWNSLGQLKGHLPCLPWQDLRVPGKGRQ